LISLHILYILCIFSTYRTYECMDVKHWLDNEQHQFTFHILYIFTILHYQTIQFIHQQLTSINQPYIFIINNHQIIITTMKQHCFIKQSSYFLFDHTIMNIKSFASYQIIISHFTKVRLFSQKSSMFKYLNKSKLPWSYISTNHLYISSNITIIQS